MLYACTISFKLLLGPWRERQNINHLLKPKQYFMNDEYNHVVIDTCDRYYCPWGVLK